MTAEEMFKELGFEYMGFELDKGYFELANERIEKFEAQENFFDTLSEQLQTKQENLFDKKGEIYDSTK